MVPKMIFGDAAYFERALREDRERGIQAYEKELLNNDAEEEFNRWLKEHKIKVEVIRSSTNPRIIFTNKNKSISYIMNPKKHVMIIGLECEFFKKMKELIADIFRKDDKNDF